MVMLLFDHGVLLTPLFDRVGCWMDAWRAGDGHTVTDNGIARRS
jgi:hypothetical protein